MVPWPSRSQSIGIGHGRVIALVHFTGGTPVAQCKLAVVRLTRLLRLILRGLRRLLLFPRH